MAANKRTETPPPAPNTDFLESKWALRLLVFSPLPVICSFFLGFPTYLRTDQALAGMLFASFLYLLMTRPGLRAIAWSIAVSASIYSLQEWLAKPITPFAQPLAVVLGSYLGLGGLFVLAARAIYLKGDAQRKAARAFAGGWMFLVLWSLLGLALPLSNSMSPTTLDPLFFAIDHGYGLDASFVLGTWMAASPLWKLLTFVVYQLLPLAPVVAVGLDLIDPKAPFRVLQLLISMAFTGFIIYWVAPAVGPIHAFAANYPHHPPDISTLSLGPLAQLGSPRNCMPSLHFGSALAVYWLLKHYGGWVRALALLFVSWTAFATLALGEHYVIDLVVALPFVVTFLGLWVTGLGWKTPARYQSVLGGLALTVCWLVLLRTQAGVLTGSPAVLWGLTLVTVAGSLSLERRLQFAASTCIRVMRSSVRSLSPAGEDSLSPLAAGTLPLDGEAPSRGF
ncbi:phosphatase PAP2 family protein [Paludibaculum fermentans]|uniref:Phosphatase PAP2 family protein n=1 Tax=Paludibaculum fermentans TaxID=1473598 RepID=A0A7S7NTM7_PALFE|nr:phosphatase PAP2 family protein [Paludibaculum fermentans]QOY89612.1 phosphatase PAP2 family protein [Paludibaculum fermentans]